MIVDDLNTIFCHVPKTGGNTLSKNIFSSWSRDELVIRGHQDGKDRFELARYQALTSSGGGYKKHMPIIDYGTFVNLIEFSVITVFRDPVERLLSLYFSPHRWFAPRAAPRLLMRLSNILDSGLDYTAKSFEERKPFFNPNDFKLLVENSRSFSDFMNGYNEVSRVMLVRFDYLQADMANFASLMGIPNELVTKGMSIHLNSSTQTVQADEAQEAAKIVHNSKHAEDYATFDEIARRFEQPWDVETAG